MKNTFHSSGTASGKVEMMNVWSIQIDTIATQVSELPRSEEQDQRHHQFAGCTPDMGQEVGGGRRPDVVRVVLDGGFLRNLSQMTHGVFCTMIDTVDEKPWLNLENPAPIQMMTMKILAAMIMSVKLVNRPKHSSVGTYCSERRDDRKMILSRMAISTMSPQ